MDLTSTLLKLQPSCWSASIETTIELVVTWKIERIQIPQMLIIQMRYLNTPLTCCSVARETLHIQRPKGYAPQFRVRETICDRSLCFWAGQVWQLRDMFSLKVDSRHLVIFWYRYFSHVTLKGLMVLEPFGVGDTPLLLGQSISPLALTARILETPRTLSSIKVKNSRATFTVS